MHSNRIFPALAALFFVHVAVGQDAATFKVQDGEAPWSDRVGTWELGDIPATLKSDDPLPQQSCNFTAEHLTHYQYRTF